jgi:hypothetical protein
MLDLLYYYAGRCSLSKVGLCLMYMEFRGLGCIHMFSNSSECNSLVSIVVNNIKNYRVVKV